MTTMRRTMGRSHAETPLHDNKNKIPEAFNQVLRKPKKYDASVAFVTAPHASWRRSANTSCTLKLLDTFLQLLIIPLCLIGENVVAAPHIALQLEHGNARGHGEAREEGSGAHSQHGAGGVVQPPRNPIRLPACWKPNSLCRLRHLDSSSLLITRMPPREVKRASDRSQGVCTSTDSSSPI